MHPCIQCAVMCLYIDSTHVHSSMCVGVHRCSGTWVCMSVYGCMYMHACTQCTCTDGWMDGWMDGLCMHGCVRVSVVVGCEVVN